MRGVILIYYRLQALPFIASIKVAILRSLFLLQATQQVNHKFMRVMLLNWVELLCDCVLQIYEINYWIL